MSIEEDRAIVCKEVVGLPEESAFVYLDSCGFKIRIASRNGKNYLHNCAVWVGIYLTLVDGIVTEAK
jgi:hypothetical protein